MKFSKPIAPQYGTIILLTVYLFAYLLPANSMAAFAQAAACGESSAAAASIEVVAVPAADQPVTISKEEVDRAAFVANWKNRYTNAEEVYHVVYNYLALSGDPNLPWAKIAIEYVEKFEKAIPLAQLNDQSLFTYDDIIHTALEVTLSIPEVAHLAPKVWQELANVNDPDAAYFPILGDSAAAVSASAWRYSLAPRMLAESSDIIARVYDCAQNNPALAQAFDQLHGEKLNASITDDAMEILAKNLGLFPEVLKGKIAADGTITVSIDELKAATEVEFEKLHTTIDGIQDSLIEIDQQQKVIVDYINQQEIKAAIEAKAKKEAAEFELQLKASQSSFTVISTLLGQLDPKMGKVASVVFNSTQQVGQALNGWLKATAGLNGLDKVTSLSTIVMTGNVLGAVMNVMGLFNTEPSIEQKILAQIGKLRQQVDQMRVEMHSRFDRIDKSLNTIYSTMQDRFNQLDVQLGKINGNLEEIQQSLGELDTQLSRIEYNNFEMLNALGRRPLLEAINGGLNYLETTGERMPYEPNFVQFANTLYTWGTLHAYDALEAGPSQTDFSDAHVIDVLNSYGTDSNINYLNGWLMAHGVPPITNKRVASPRDWLLTSRAFTQLGIEWPEHMGRYDAQRQADLDKVGEEIQAAITNISTLQTPTGPQGNHLLFDKVVANYQEKLDALLTGIETQVETPFLTSVQGGTGFNLYGGVRQQINYLPVAFSGTTCNNGSVEVGVPHNLNKLVPDFDLYSLAEFLNQGSFSSCWSAHTSNVREVCNPKTLECHTIGIVSGIIRVGFEGVSFGSVGGSLGQIVIEDGMDLEDYLLNNWGTVVTEMESFLANREPAASGDPKYAPLLAATTTKIDSHMAARQQELYGRVAQAVASGPLKPLAVELAGAKALLHSFASLGLSRAVTNDEFLRAMLFGDQQVVEDQQILQSYSIGATQPITDLNRSVNVRTVIEQNAVKRTTALNGLISEYLDAISAGTHVETPDYISTLRRMMEFSMKIAHIEVDAPEPQPGETPGPGGTPDPGETPQPGETPEPGGGPAGDTTSIHLPLISR